MTGNLPIPDGGGCRGFFPYQFQVMTQGVPVREIGTAVCLQAVVLLKKRIALPDIDSILLC